MTVSYRTSRAQQRRPEPTPHLFRVGQMVLMKPKYGQSPKAAELFRVTGTLPARDNSPQYRIRSDDERHDRVATQDSLELFGATSSGNSTTLAERTFGNGQRTEAQQPRTSEAEAEEGSTDS